MSVAREYHVADVIYDGVLMDWRGTLVVAPSDRWLVQKALTLLGRDASAAAIDEVVDRLHAADTGEVESSAIDADAASHRRAYRAWFKAASVDVELAECIYAVESDATLNPFAADVGPMLRTLRTAGVRIGVVSDIHVDLRPVFARHPNTHDGAAVELGIATLLLPSLRHPQDLRLQRVVDAVIPGASLVGA
jgi:phosphoglycolate phosphatase-like HAD superfamily hydrolase